MDVHRKACGHYGRLPREVRTYRLSRLAGHRVLAHRPRRHARDDYGGLQQDRRRPRRVNLQKPVLCNRQGTAHYLLLMPGDKPFRTKELSKQLGVARLSFANEADMLEMLDIQPGAVSVMGLMNDKEHRVRLIVDGDVLRQEYFGCHPCVNTSSLKMRTRDVTEVFLPSTGHDMTVVELTGEG